MFIKTSFLGRNICMYLRQSINRHPASWYKPPLHGCTIRLLGVGCRHLTPLTLSQVQDSYKASEEGQYCCIPFIHENILHPFLNDRIYLRQWINKTNLKFWKFFAEHHENKKTIAPPAFTKTTKNIKQCIGLKHIQHVILSYLKRKRKNSWIQACWVIFSSPQTTFKRAGKFLWCIVLQKNRVDQFINQT